jgi:hypothetical protein
MTERAQEPDHDQRLKILTREFLREFFALFFPLWVERFDFTKVEWLDKEVFLDPPQGEHLREVTAMVKTLNELQVEQRLKEREQAIKRQRDREILRLALETRFGQLTPGMQQRLDAIPPERLGEVLVQVVKGQSLLEMGLVP